MLWFFGVCQQLSKLFCLLISVGEVNVFGCAGCARRFFCLCVFQVLWCVDLTRLNALVIWCSV